jgi:UDP-N-acetylglucosamine 2-epimerase (non-hydrolysing)
MRIPVFHMEAGNRCYDDRVPEEINRRVIDHVSDVLMPYTHRSKENLIREGVERDRIFVTGNPIYEVLEANRSGVENSTILERLHVEPARFFLATLHRAENVDDYQRLSQLFSGLRRVVDTFQEPLIVSVHPRTADRLAEHGLDPSSDKIRLVPPLGFFDFVKLEKSARCVLSDSGTVQEECAILGTPSVTLRDVTERAETLEAGSNMLTGCDPELIVNSVVAVTKLSRGWRPPAEYLEPVVSTTVAKIILGYTRTRK